MMAFGEVFDVDRLSRSIHKDVLEWRDVKIVSEGYGWQDDVRMGQGEDEELEQEDAVELLGCWSVWAAANLYEKTFRGSLFPPILNLGTSPSPMALCPGHWLNNIIF